MIYPFDESSGRIEIETEQPLGTLVHHMALVVRPLLKLDVDADPAIFDEVAGHNSPNARL
jgi:hypothetical protein